MQIAFLLYEGFTPLDAVGPCRVLSALPDAAVFVAEQAGLVRSDSGCTIVAEQSLADTTCPDVMVLPGSLTSFTSMDRNESVVGWLRQVRPRGQYMTSVCTGSLLLAAAGLLVGPKATTHWAARELLADFGVDIVAQRVVDTRRVITAAGVSSGIGMALRLDRRAHSDGVAQAIQHGIEYAAAPRFDSGPAEKPARDMPGQYSPTCHLAALIGTRAGPLAGRPVDVSQWAGQQNSATVLRAASGAVMAEVTALAGQLRDQSRPALRYDPADPVPGTGSAARGAPGPSPSAQAAPVAEAAAENTGSGALISPRTGRR